MSTIISRETRGARHRDGFHNGRVGRLDKWLHHSLIKHLSTDALLSSEYAETRNLDDIGQARFKCGISHTFVMFPAGRIHEALSIGRVGAHTAGRISISVGPCLAGNYKTNSVTAELVASLP